MSLPSINEIKEALSNENWISFTSDNVQKCIKEVKQLSNDQILAISISESRDVYNLPKFLNTVARKLAKHKHLQVAYNAMGFDVSQSISLTENIFSRVHAQTAVHLNILGLERESLDYVERWSKSWSIYSLCLYGIPRDFSLLFKFLSSPECQVVYLYLRMDDDSQELLKLLYTKESSVKYLCCYGGKLEDIKTARSVSWENGLLPEGIEWRSDDSSGDPNLTVFVDGLPELEEQGRMVNAVRNNLLAKNTS